MKLNVLPSPELYAEVLPVLFPGYRQGLVAKDLTHEAGSVSSANSHALEAIFQFRRSWNSGIEMKIKHGAREEECRKADWMCEGHPQADEWQQKLNRTVDFFEPLAERKQIPYFKSTMHSKYFVLSMYDFRQMSFQNGCCHLPWTLTCMVLAIPGPMPLWASHW